LYSGCSKVCLCSCFQQLYKVYVSVVICIL
jgi:hypothetical protein